jgi:hypothetical protein
VDDAAVAVKKEVGGKLNTSTAPGTNGTPLPVAVTAAALVTAIAAVAPTPKKATTVPALITRYWLVGGVTAVKVGRICAAAGAVALAVTTTVGPFGKNADCSLAMFIFQVCSKGFILKEFRRYFLVATNHYFQAKEHFVLEFDLIRGQLLIVLL